MQTGDMITEDDVRSVRPGYGLAPKFIGSIIGKRVSKSVNANTAVTNEIILND